MIVDSSAIVAMFRLEPEAGDFARAIEQAPVVRVSGVSVVECSIVLGPQLDGAIEEFLQSTNARVEPITIEQIGLARDAHRRFGRGSGSPARLNFGDCFSYALAKYRDEPLLFTGTDFIHTDLTRATR